MRIKEQKLRLPPPPLRLFLKMGCSDLLLQGVSKHSTLFDFNMQLVMLTVTFITMLTQCSSQSITRQILFKWQHFIVLGSSK